MTRQPIRGQWKRKLNTPGQWWYRCGGEGCGRRLAEYREGEPLPLSLEPGYSNYERATGKKLRVWVRSPRPKHQYRERGRDRQARKRLGWPQQGANQAPPNTLAPHPKQRSLVLEPDDMPVLAICHECAALNLIEPPKEG